MTENRNRKRKTKAIEKIWERERERENKKKVKYKSSGNRGHTTVRSVAVVALMEDFSIWKRTNELYLRHSSLLLSIWWEIENALKFHLYYKVLQKVIYRSSIWEKKNKLSMYNCEIWDVREKGSGMKTVHCLKEMNWDFIQNQFNLKPHATICTWWRGCIVSYNEISSELTPRSTLNVVMLYHTITCILFEKEEEKKRS